MINNNLLKIEMLKDFSFDKVKVFKNIYEPQDKFTFEDIWGALAFKYHKNTIKVPPLMSVNLDDIFDYTFQLYDMQNHTKLFSAHQQLSKVFNKDIEDKNFNADIFFSVRGNNGVIHKDNESVFIVSLLGTTYYDVPEHNKVYEIDETDAIYIPCGIAHTASSIKKRIVCSWGVFK
tara:strand:- start:12 stop:539 length:528 start_codon:yes stop_codon:yes gene_type:complete